MIITIDGLSGAGKTTQALILAERLGIPKRAIDVELSTLRDITLLMTDHHYDPSYISLLQSLTLFRTMCQKWKKNFVYCDWFFRMLIPAWRKGRIDEVFDVFQDILTCWNGEEPTASFYLHMDGNVREKRRFYREATQLNTYQLDDVKLSVTNSNDQEFLNLCGYLQSKISYLHIIDGNQDKEKVSADIWSILNKMGIGV